MTTFLLSTLVLPGEAVTCNEDDLQFAKLYHCINVIGSRSMCYVLKAVWSKENLGEEIQTLRHYCRIKLSWTQKALKIFDKFEQQYLDNNIYSDVYDICYLCKVLQNVLDHVYCQLDPDCQDHIKKLQKKRNKVCHYYGHMEGNLSKEIDDLKETLKSIYTGVGKCLDIDFTQNIKEMEHVLTEILDTNFVIGEQGKAIETFEENKRSKMIIQGRKELEAHYKKLRVLNPCTWINDKDDKVCRFEVDKIFTPLKLEGRMEIELKAIFTAKVRRDTILPPILIYKGLAGSGKSALCRYLIFNWHTKKEEIDMLSSFDLVFFLEIRRIRCSKVIDFLQETLLKDTCKSFDSKDVILVLKGLDLLFIIDGYDESGEQAKKLVQDILAIFSEHRIIITTRPDYHEDVISLAKRYAAFQSVEVCGFDDRRKKEFTTKVFSVIEEDKDRCKRQINDFLEYLNNRGQALDEHLKLPLTLALLIYLWKESPDIVNSVTSATRLYMELFRLCKKKLAERLCCTKVFMGSKLYSHLDDLILLLGEQAWLMLKDAKNLVGKDIYCILEKECKARSIDITELMSAFLMCHVDEDDDKLVYEFLHKTQMEYLAAGFLADEIKKGKRTLEDIEQDIGYSSWRHHQEVLKYLTGHLAIHRQQKPDILKISFPHLSKLFSVAEIQSNDYNYWWNLVVESLYDHSVCEGIAQNQLPVKDWELNARQVVSGLNLLIKTSVSLRNLNIEISCDVEPYEIKYFLDTMKSLKVEIGHRYNKSCPILVEMHFWRHVQYDHDRPSDEFLRTLYPWGHLINFTGSLGEQQQGREVLAYCFNLKNIRARVSSPKALACLSKSLDKIWKSVRCIRLTLVIPVEVRPEELPVLNFRGTLELMLMNIRDVDKEWLVKVVKRIGENGVFRLTLNWSELTFDGITWVLMNLRDVGLTKISLQQVHEPNAKELECLAKLQETVGIEIVWGKG